MLQFHELTVQLPAIVRLLPQPGAEPLRGITETTLGPGGKPVRLLIVGFDYERNKAVYFRAVAATNPGLATGAPAPAQVRLASAVHGSTDAPINSFDAPASLQSYPDHIWTGDLGTLAAAILDDPPDAASFIVHTITGGSCGMTAPGVSRVVHSRPALRRPRQSASPSRRRRS
jgi:hypothetical protein